MNTNCQPETTRGRDSEPFVGRVSPADYRKVVGRALHSHSTKSPKYGDISRWLSPTYMLAFLTAFAYALPTDGNISAGSGSIDQSGATMTVNQTSQNLAINWQQYCGRG